MLRLMILLFFFLFASEPSIAQKNDCNLYNSEYIPQLQTEEPSDQLKFKLTFEQAELDTSTTLRNIFLNFTAYDGQTGQKLSTMRLSDVWSNGVSRRAFSTYYGQFSHPHNQQEWVDFKPSAGFHLIGINKDLSPAKLEQVPDLLIFPETYLTLRSHSYNQPENWDYYIKFFTEERIYPDFRGQDYWVRSKCGQPDQKYETSIMCDGTTSKITTYCNPDNLSLCQKQHWDTGNRIVELSFRNEIGFKAHTWACVNSKHGPMLVLYYSNHGNCDDCERFEIWDMTARRQADWQNFQEAYNELEMPDLLGADFRAQFHPINSGSSD